MLNILNLSKNRLHTPKTPINIPKNSVHIWKTNINPLPYPGDTVIQQLSENEQRKAYSHYFKKDTQSYVIRKMNLRKILSYYLNVEPLEVKFTTNPFGKPLLAHVHDNLEFTTSCSENLVLYAISKGRKIGIDVEKTREIQEINQIAERYFSKQEKKLLNNVQKNRKIEAFYSIWTRKEAYLKAMGSGWSCYDEKFNLSSDLEITLLTFTPSPGYIASISVEGTNLRLKFIDEKMDNFRVNEIDTLKDVRGISA